MRASKLRNIQWKQMRAAIGISFISTVIVTICIFLFFRLDLRVLLFNKWLHLPLFFWLLLFIVISGGIAGYSYGNQLKKRLETLIISTLSFQRGNLAHRLPPLGDDEIGLVAEHLNEMAVRIEKQVVSLQKLSSEKVELQEKMKQSVISAERQRIARELHDAVSQQLFAISMMTSAVLETIAEHEAEKPKMKKQLEMIEKMAGDAQNEMRALLLHLRPATLEGKRLREGVEELLNEFKEKQQIQIQWNIEELPSLPIGIEDHVFRIIQEGLSNVFRHSRATSVFVHLSVKHRRLHLKIVDNGVGFEMSQSKLSSYGLQSIQERANEIGGIVEVLSFPERGTQIDVKVPLVEKKER